MLGSAQILLEHAGERVVITGDYKRRADPTCPPFEVTPCDIFITEATFGLPVFTHPPIAEEMAKLLDALDAHPDRCVLVGAYALGKAQRRDRGTARGGAYRSRSTCTARWRRCAGCTRNSASILANCGWWPIMTRTTCAARSSSARPLPSTTAGAAACPIRITAMASGWMRVRQRARQRNVELPLVISDHADWNELTRTIEEVNPHETWITHGREEALLRWCQLHQRRARALALVGYEDEDD